MPARIDYTGGADARLKALHLQLDEHIRKEVERRKPMVPGEDHAEVTAADIDAVVSSLSAQPGGPFGPVLPAVSVFYAIAGLMTSVVALILPLLRELQHSDGTRYTLLLFGLVSLSFGFLGLWGSWYFAILRQARQRRLGRLLNYPVEHAESITLREAVTDHISRAPDREPSEPTPSVHK